MNSEQSRADGDSALRSALTESQVLLAELDHRMKNVMQMIAAFLSLQAKDAKTPEVRAALNDVMRRVQGLDVAQRALLKLGALDNVNLSAFLPAVIEELMALEGRPGVTCELAVRPVDTSVDQASALGLVVSELTTNALKHAFPGGGGVIRLEVGPVGADRGRVVVTDNGVGLSGFESRDDGLGMNLIQALARQARAQLAIATDAGFRAALEFPLARPNGGPGEAAGAERPSSEVEPNPGLDALQ
jgi:two-component sensor histidine kinase